MKQVTHKLRTAVNFVNYLLTAADQHGVHSPFVFDLTVNCLYDQKQFYGYEKVYPLRSKYLRDTRFIEVHDFGAKGKGSVKNRRVRDIFLDTSKPVKYAELLTRLTYHLKPVNILELGTSLGLSSVHLSIGNPSASLTTIEGCPNIASIAGNTFTESGFENITLINSQFNNVLDQLIVEKGPFDFVFIDGDHRGEATLRYFEKLWQQLPENGVIVFDDIRWSAGMEEAWKKIIGDALIPVSVDLFFMGMVFKRYGQRKQNFVIRF